MNLAAISELAWRHTFVDELPADPSRENRPRQVHAAAYSRVEPSPVPAPKLLAIIPEVAALLGLDPRETPELVALLAGNRVLPDMIPFAANYGGHQFGTWAGQLGDGRAIGLGEVVGARGKRWELQLKGAGPTPYSRRADGRAVLRSSMRELVCSEAMHHLGVPTTRALSLVTTGAAVSRDMLYDGHPADEPGAIVCRVAPTFLRFGNFELPTSRGDRATLERLVEFTVAHWYPWCRRAGGAPDIPALLSAIASRTAWMVAEWLRVGFVHGVMNTDNMSILGLTIDYGPYGWLEPFDLDWTPNTTDASGKRYRFGHQAAVAHWNLAQLARALAPLAGTQPAELAPLQRVLDQFRVDLGEHHRHNTLRKLGLSAYRGHAAADDSLLAGLAEILSAAGSEPWIDMTLWFRALAQPLAGASALADAFYREPSRGEREAIGRWLAQYGERIRGEQIDDRERAARMTAINPLYVPRNYLLQLAIDGELPLAELIDTLRTPYREQPGRERFAQKRPEWARHKVGCSMLSCSS